MTVPPTDNSAVSPSFAEPVATHSWSTIQHENAGH